MADQCKVQEATTKKVFCTVLKLAKMNQPLSDIKHEVELQCLNRMNLGRVLHSNHSCANIVEHIAKEMHQKVIETIISGNAKVSLLIKESTSLSQKATLEIYLCSPL
jgi:hypothetical protein